MKIFYLLLIMAVAHLVAQESTSQPGQTAPQPSSGNQAAVPSAASSTDVPAKITANATEYRPGVGTIIVTELANGINAKKAKVGDRVECTVTQDLLFKGKVVVPMNAKVIGHVTEAEGFTKDSHNSRLGLTFEKIVLSGKKELLFQGPAIVVALAPPVKQMVRTATDMRNLPVQMQNNSTSPGTGSSTGASIMSSIANNADIVGANVASTGGIIGGSDRGVIGWPDLFILKGPTGTSVIASPKVNVELGFQTQLVLRIAEGN